MNPMDELIIPVGPRFVPPGAMKGKAIGIGDPTQIAASFGRAYKPQMPLYLVGPDKRTVILVAGMGQATAAELEDVALAALDQERESSFEATRAAMGRPQQDTLVANLGNLIEERQRDAKRNHRTQATREFIKKVF